MSERYSRPEDNAGRCESCNRPETVYQAQTTYPVLLGGGIGRGTMWLCSRCLAEHQERDALRAALGRRAECEVCHRVWAVQGLLEDHDRCPGCHSRRVTLGAPVSAPAAPGGPQGRPDGQEHR